MKTLERPPAIEPLDAVSKKSVSKDAIVSRRKVEARVRRSPLKIADEYVLRNVVGATLRGLLWFGGLLFMVTVIAAMRRVVDGSLSWAGVWDLTSSDVPRILVFTLPMSVLYGSVQTFAELSSKGEATALQVGGMSVGRMMRAPLLWGAFSGLCVFILQERFVPQTQQKKQNIIAHAIVHAPTKTKKPQADLRLSDPPEGKGTLKSLIQAKNPDFQNGTMEQPRIQLFNAQQRLVRQISAPRATWNARLRKWQLQRAVVTDISADGAKVTVSPPRDIEYSMLPPSELGAKSMTFLQHLDNGDFEMASISDLRDHRNALQNTVSQQNADEKTRTERLVNSMTYGIHDKIATGFVCLFLVLIGAPLAMRSQRSGGGFAMGISLIVLMGYYILWTCSQNLGRGGEVNPVFFGYLPLAVTATLGLVLFWKKTR